MQTTHIEKEKEPSFWINHSFLDLVPFPRLIFDTCLVISNAADHMVFLFLCKEKGFHGRRWHEEKHKYRPGKCNRTDNQKEILPNGQGSMYVTNSPGQESIDNGTSSCED